MLGLQGPLRCPSLFLALRPCRFHPFDLQLQGSSLAFQFFQGLPAFPEPAADAERQEHEEYHRHQETHPGPHQKGQVR